MQTSACDSSRAVDASSDVAEEAVIAPHNRSSALFAAQQHASAEILSDSMTEHLICVHRRYPVRVWVDSAHGGRRRMDTWNGTNVLITEPGLEIEVSPHVDRLKCLMFETGKQNEDPAAQRTAGTIHKALQLHGVRNIAQGLVIMRTIPA